MRKYLIMLAVATCASLAVAQHVPVQYVHTHTNRSVNSSWTVPARQNGALLSLQMLGITNSATVYVRHISPYSSTASVTNAIETAAAVNTRYVYPSAYVPPVTAYYVTNNVILTATSTPVKPFWLSAGDKLHFPLSSTTSPMTVLINTSLRE
jgi:hypothetical protein